jgi:hypothetical protein
MMRMSVEANRHVVIDVHQGLAYVVDHDGEEASYFSAPYNLSPAFFEEVSKLCALVDPEKNVSPCNAAERNRRRRLIETSK